MILMEVAYQVKWLNLLHNLELLMNEQRILQDQEVIFNLTILDYEIIKAAKIAFEKQPPIYSIGTQKRDGLAQKNNVPGRIIIFRNLAG